MRCPECENSVSDRANACPISAPMREQPQPMRTLDEIRADILALEQEGVGLLGEIVGEVAK